MQRLTAAHRRRWEGGHLYTWHSACPPRPRGEELAQLRWERSEAAQEGDWQAVQELDLLIDPGRESDARRLRDPGAGLGALLQKGALPLTFCYDLGAGNRVEVALQATRPLAAADAAEALPRFAGWAEVAAAGPQPTPCFDASYPSLVRLAHGAGRGFALGEGVGCDLVAMAWTPTHLVTQCEGGTFQEDDLPRHLAHLERRCEAARRGVWDDDQDPEAPCDGPALSAEQPEEEEDGWMWEASTLPPPPSPRPSPTAEQEEEWRQVRLQCDAAALARQEAPRPPPAPAPPAMRFQAAFPAVADALTAGKRYWLYYENKRLRLFRGLWRGAGKRALWEAPQRHARVHDALAALEAHLRVGTGRGRKLVAAWRRAVRERARAAKLEAQKARRAGMA